MLCFIVFLDWLFLPSCKGKPSVSEVSFHSFFFSCIACLRCLSIAQHQFIASAAVLITCRLHNRQCKEWTSMALYVAHKLRGEFLFQHHSCDAHLSCRHLKKSRESAQKKKERKHTVCADHWDSRRENLLRRNTFFLFSSVGANCRWEKVSE